MSDIGHHDAPAREQIIPTVTLEIVGGGGGGGGGGGRREGAGKEVMLYYTLYPVYVFVIVAIHLNYHCERGIDSFTT